MAAKDLMFNTDARAKLKKGVDALAEAVKVTLAGTSSSTRSSARRPSPRTA